MTNGDSENMYKKTLRALLFAAVIPVILLIMYVIFSLVTVIVIFGHRFLMWIFYTFY